MKLNYGSLVFGEGLGRVWWLLQSVLVSERSFSRTMSVGSRFVVVPLEARPSFGR